MKIREYAESKNMTKGNVYSLINKSRYSIKQITNERTGEITPRGMEILESIFAGADEKIPDETEKLKETIASLNQTVNRLSETVQERERTISELRETLRRSEQKTDEWEKRFFSQQQQNTEERDRMNTLLGQQQELLSQAQKNLSQQQQLQFITGEKPGFFKRLFGGRTES